jgi:hypothetical protein
MLHSVPKLEDSCENVNETSVSTKGDEYRQKMTNNALSSEKGSDPYRDIVYFIYLCKRHEF